MIRKETSNCTRCIHHFVKRKNCNDLGNYKGIAALKLKSHKKVLLNFCFNSMRLFILKSNCDIKKFSCKSSILFVVEKKRWKGFGGKNYCLVELIEEVFSSY